MFRLALFASTVVGDPVGYFLRDFPDKSTSTAPFSSKLSWLEGTTHYRLIPGEFPDGMEYHFDGLATVVKFEFKDGQVNSLGRRYESGAVKHWDQCEFFGSGTNKLGFRPCLTNPLVNLLPIQGQLWLTIDTAFWGRMDPVTLDTIEAKAKVASTVLNAHPACDPKTNECFVQHPCGKNGSPLSPLVCVSKLTPTDSNLDTELISQASLDKNKLIQHSHSPCVTSNFIVSKLDSFGRRKDNVSGTAGLLHILHQLDGTEWLLMDRRTNKSTIYTSQISFVNNHFINCVEDSVGNVIVETVTATDSYLDTYFKQNLEGVAPWSTMFQAPSRCVLATDGSGTGIKCTDLLDDKQLLFDYPTFNPHFKMNAAYKYFYGIAPKSRTTSRWFDSIIKVDRSQNPATVTKSWSSPGVYVTEADFIPKPGGLEEDDGVLLSILYNASSDKSSIGLFEPKTLEMLDQIPLAQVLPFHAHGISCANGHCYTNP